ncbi:tetratricopeptide repeat protein [bacterium]|nr:tetratricopeptide repeat protein [bacterium]
MLLMAYIRIQLIGAFQLWLGDQPVSEITSPKIQALLAYLAVESKRVHSRDQLATLLWPDLSQQKARQNLRQSLSRLQKAIPQAADDIPILHVTRQEVGFNRTCAYTLDVEDYTSVLNSTHNHAHEDVVHCAECCRRLATAISKQAGDFLDGLAADSLPFEEWAMLKREWIRREQLAALDILIQHAFWCEDYKAAYNYAWRQIEIDPLYEEAHTDAMRALALDGRARNALAQFEQLCAVLDAELGVRPSAESNALAQEISAGLFPQRGQAPLSAQPPTPQKIEIDVRTSLPPQFTPFVGRSDELTRIDELIVQPHCHLLTMVGVGGVGKTRLAVEAAQQAADHFVDGVYFVPLVAVTSPTQLVTAIAHAIGFTLPLVSYTLAEQQDALVRYLRTRTLLLVLDNYEHLLPEVELIAQLLQGAPGLMLVITSRAPLELRAEWIIEIDGLPFPPLHGPAKPTADYAAVQLFTTTVERIKPGALRLDTAAPEIARICALVQGMPLALELAAARVRTLPVDEVADAIAADLGFLSTSMRDVPERHRSLRAVIDQSWRLLSANEQRLFAGLSVFRGDFSQDAALTVTGAETETEKQRGEVLLQRLVAHSLLRRRGESRYEIHETLRQYAANKLAENNVFSETLRHRFATYFLELAVHLEDDFNGRDVLGAQETLYAEIENLRQAWAWAVDDGHAEQIGRSVTSVFRFFNGVGLMQEGESTLEAAVAAFRPLGKAVVTARVLCKLSRLQNSRGRFEPAAAAAEDAIALLNSVPPDAAARQDNTPPLQHIEAEAWQQLGRSMLHLGRFNEADGHLEQAMSLLGELANATLDQLALAAEMQFNLGTIAGFQSNYKAAHTHDMEALRLARLSGDRHLEAIALNNLGSVAELSGRIDEAIDYFEQSLAIFELLAYRRGTANCLSNLGASMSWRGELTDALNRHQDALRINQEVGDIGGEGWTLMAIGSIFYRLGQMQNAHRSLQQALELNREGTLSMDTWASYHMAQVTLGQGQLDEARRWIEQSYTLARSMEDEMSAADAEMLWGQIELRLGRWEKAEEYFGRGLQAIQKYNHLQGEVGAQVERSYLAQITGNLEDALAHAEAALAVPNTAHLLLTRAHALTQQGRVLAALGDVAGAEDALADALAMRRQMAQPHHVAEVQSLQARLWLAAGRQDEACHAAEAVLAHVRAGDGPGSVDGVPDPIDVFVTAAAVLEAVAAPGADELRDATRVRLQREVESLADPQERARFLAMWQRN